MKLEGGQATLKHADEKNTIKTPEGQLYADSNNVPRHDAVAVQSKTGNLKRQQQTHWWRTLDKERKGVLSIGV